MSKVIKGRGKILFYDEKDREKMNKKYPELDFEKMNPLTFTTKYKGNKQFEVEIQVKDTKIPCSIQKWAWPWKYGTKVELRLYFKDLKKKAITHITGGIQHELFRFFRYDYEKMIKDDPKLQKNLKLHEKVSKLTTKQKKKMNAYLIEKYGYKKWAEDEDPELGKEYVRILKNPDKFLKGGCGQRGGKQTRKTFKSEQKKENKKYYQSVKKCRKIKDKKKKAKCYLPIDKKRFADLQYLEKKYPDEWSEFKNKPDNMGSGSFHEATRLEGSWLYDWNPYKNKRSSKRTKKGGARRHQGKKKTFKSEKKKENIDYWKCVKQNKNTQKCNTKRDKTLKYLEKKYPKEWSQYQIDFQTNPKLRY